MPQLSQPWLAALRVHRLQGLIRQVQVAETNLWETHGDPDLLQFASGVALEFLMHIIQNHFPNERNVGGALNETGHQLPIPHLPPVGSATPQLRVQERLSLFDSRPGWLFSDTADYLLDFLREADPDTVYLPPMQWTSQGVSAFNDLCSPIQASQKSIGLILWEQHWVLCEFHSTVCASWLFLTGPPELRPLAVQCATALCQHLGIELSRYLMWCAGTFMPILTCVGGPCFGSALRRLASKSTILDLYTRLPFFAASTMLMFNGS